MYGEQTKLTIENMSFSGVALSEFPEYIQSLVQIKYACALANYRAGLLEKETFQAIETACEKMSQMSQASLEENFPVDVFHGGGGIGINMNINEVLSALTDGKADPIDHINMSQSTSDVCHTSLRVTVYRLIEKLEEKLDFFCQCMEVKIQEFEGIKTIARTCLQDGMQVSVNALWKGVLASVKRCREHLIEVKYYMTRVNLGWTVIGTGTGASDAYRQQILNALEETTKINLIWRTSPYDAAQNPDDLVRVSAEVSTIAAIMSKFSRDLRLLSSGPETGFFELKVPPVQKGSSFFPGKINPVIPEMMIQCNFLIQGNHTILLNALEAGEIHLNLWEEMMGFLLMQNITRLTKAMFLFTEKCVSGVTCNEAVCQQYSVSSVPMVVKYKEIYGYQETTRRVCEYGMDGFVRQCQEEERKR